MEFPMTTLPLYDRLKTMEAIFTQGLSSAEQRGDNNRVATYRECLEMTEKRIKALEKPVYPTQQREQIAALTRAYKAKQVTPREFGLRMWGVLRYAK